MRLILLCSTVPSLSCWNATGNLILKKRELGVLTTICIPHYVSGRNYSQLLELGLDITWLKYLRLQRNSYFHFIGPSHLLISEKQYFTQKKEEKSWSLVFFSLLHSEEYIPGRNCQWWLPVVCNFQLSPVWNWLGWISRSSYSCRDHYTHIVGYIWSQRNFESRPAANL